MYGDRGKIGEVARKRSVDLVTGESRTPGLSLASYLYVVCRHVLCLRRFRYRESRDEGCGAKNEKSAEYFEGLHIGRSQNVEGRQRYSDSELRMDLYMAATGRQDRRMM